MPTYLLALSLLLVACGAAPSANPTPDAVVTDASLDTGPCALAGSLCACGVGAGRLPGQLVCVDASLTCECPAGDAGSVDVARDTGCVPGTVRVCPCPSGDFGMQACTEFGLDACRCSAPMPPADVVDMRDVIDASDAARSDVCTSMTVSDCCGVSCVSPSAEQRCTAGACVFVACRAPYLNCDGRVGNGCEVNVHTDSANCGDCNAPCGAGMRCVVGKCV
jgi:hypothetical protein